MQLNGSPPYRAHKTLTFRQPRLPNPNEFRPSKAELAIVCPSSSPLSSFHVFSNSAGSWQLRGDHGALSRVTIPGGNPVPHLQDLILAPSSFTFFSHTNLARAHNQTLVEKIDIPKMEVTMTFGLFEFLSFPFNFNKPAQTFHGFMEEVKLSLRNVYVYPENMLLQATRRRDTQLYYDLFPGHLASLTQRITSKYEI